MKLKCVIKIMYLALVVLVCSNAVIGSVNSHKVEPIVYDILKNQSTVEVIVFFHDNSLIDNIKPDKILNNKHILKEERKNIQDHLLARLSNKNFKLEKQFWIVNAVSAEVDNSSIQELVRNKGVKYIYYDRPGYIQLSKSTETIHSTEVNDLGFSGQGQTVCVIDTGIDYRHESLGNCTQEEFLLGSCSKVVDGYDFANKDADPLDDLGHGTHVAGIVAANGEIRGVAPDANLAALKACNASGFCKTQDRIAALEWCSDNADKYNINVITVSVVDEIGIKTLESDYCPDHPIAETIRAITNNGIIVVQASGNDGRWDEVASPACIEEITTVAATRTIGKKSEISRSSNRWPYLDLLAPGVGIKSTELGGGESEPLIGTSYAAPHVAGAAAIIYQVEEQLRGTDPTPDEVENILKETGNFIQDPNSEIKRSYPLIDLERAVNSIYMDTLNITISNSGSGDLLVDSIGSDVTWLDINPTKFVGSNSISEGQSEIVGVTADVRELRPSSYFTNIIIDSNDPDEAQLEVPILLNFKGKVRLSDHLKAEIAKLKFWWATFWVDHGSAAETDYEQIILDWPTNDELDFILTSPDGLNYTKKNVTDGFEFEDGHPKIITLSLPVLKNGTWIITVNATSISKGSTEFTLETKPYPSDIPPTGIDFTDVKMGYLDICQDENGLRILMEASNATGTSINIKNKTNISMSAFLTGLVIPNDKQILNLPRGDVDIDDTFAHTEAANIMLQADVDLKSQDQAEWVSIINDSYVFWDDLINETSYYDKVISRTDWYYPDFTARRTIKPGEIVFNGSGCEVYVGNLELDAEIVIEDAWVNYEDYGLDSAELENVTANLEIWKDYMQNLSDERSIPALKDALNNDDNYSDLRRVLASFALAQWYKERDKSSLMFDKFIDNKNKEEVF